MADAIEELLQIADQVCREGSTATHREWERLRDRLRKSVDRATAATHDDFMREVRDVGAQLQPMPMRTDCRVCFVSSADDADAVNAYFEQGWEVDDRVIMSNAVLFILCRTMPAGMTLGENGGATDAT